jgi:hypothetical protein
MMQLTQYRFGSEFAGRGEKMERQLHCLACVRLSALRASV